MVFPIFFAAVPAINAPLNTLPLVQGQKHNLMYSSCQFECISDA